MKKITVMGVGYIGLPTSVTFALAGYEVLGVDIKRNIVDTLNAGSLHIAEPGLKTAFDLASASGRLRFATAPEPADMFIISVQTPYKETDDGKKEADLTYVDSAAKMIAAVLKKGDLVALESTVPPGTTKRVRDMLIKDCGFDNFHTVHCPERVVPGRTLQELRQNNRIIGGDNASAQLASKFYKSVCTEGDIYLTDEVTAEMCKLAENTYRDINIAYANELSKVCGKFGVDVFKMISLANLHPRVNIISPGVGVGGHCVAVDPWFLHECAPELTPLINCARTINDSKPAWVAGEVAKRVNPGAEICVLGLTFKADVDDLRGSPSLELCGILRGMGFKVTGCEPNVPEIPDIKNLTLDEALSSGGFIVVAQKHSQFVKRRKDIMSCRHYDCTGMI